MRLLSRLSSASAGLCCVLALHASLALADDDPRRASVRCALADPPDSVACDYRHDASLEVREVSLEVGGVAVQIPDKGLKKYPAPGQVTAALILVDVSDPRRKSTVEVKNRKAVAEILGHKRADQKVGLAVFDTDMRVLAPIGAADDALTAAAAQVKAGGQATEFYKNILAAIDVLKAVEASRKALIVMSDGKDEDRAYTRADVLRAAQEAGVVIAGLGYLEKPVDSPYLQTLKRLAEEAYGVYYDATEQPLPAALVDNPLGFVEKGGRVTAPYGTVIGSQSVRVTLGLAEGKTLSLSYSVDFPDKRNRQQRALDWGRQYWYYLLGGLLAFVLLVTLLMRSRRRRRREQPRIIEYAYLREMDGSGTRHVLTKTAVRLGRGADNEVVLSNDSVSSHHAEIHRRRTGDFYIVDLSSANGVYVNDAQVTQAELHEGDLIELGEVRLRFTLN